MKKILAIIRHEIGAILGRRSYLFTILFMPVIGFMVYSGASVINRGIAPEGVTAFFADSASPSPQGVVDLSGIIEEIPPSIENGLQLFDGIAEARGALASGEINDYFVIAEDYLESGNVDFIQKQYNFLATTSETDALRELIIYSLMDDAVLTERYLDPAGFNITYLTEQAAAQQTGPDSFWLPYSLMVMFYILIIGASSLMLTSITHEKENRVMELLLTSVSPREMLIGKIIALGLTGLLQTVVWLGSSYILIRLAGRDFALPDALLLTPGLLAWGVLFFMLGYALYASMMAGLGALVPNPKEGSQATLVVIFPLVIPMFFSNLVAAAPNAPIFIFFSIFPLTAPISMVSRMAATAVPAWQIALAVLLQISTTVFIVRGVSRIFRAQTLLSGKPFNLKEYLAAFIRRA